MNPYLACLSDELLSDAIYSIIKTASDGDESKHFISDHLDRIYNSNMSYRSMFMWNKSELPAEVWNTLNDLAKSKHDELHKYNYSLHVSLYGQYFLIETCTDNNGVQRLKSIPLSVHKKVKPYL